MIEKAEPIAQKDSLSKTCLFVEDDERTATLQKKVCESKGYQCYLAKSGKQALKLLQNIQTPRLIFIDFYLEDMDAPQLIKELEATQPELLKDSSLVVLSVLQADTYWAKTFEKWGIPVVEKFSQTHRFLEILDQYSQ